jgi:uncharacterized membrane protein YuzA (DUF378 family)
MLRQAAAPVGLVLAGAVALLVWGDTTAGMAAGYALVGVAAVVAISLVFLAVGRSEDAERAAAEAPPEEPEDPHPRPALDRRRPLPPRRPS